MSDKDITKKQLLAEIHQLREKLVNARSKNHQDIGLLTDNTFKSLIDQSPISTQVLSPDGKTVHVNRAWEKLWGVPLEALADYNLLEDQQLIDRAHAIYPKRFCWRNH